MNLSPRTNCARLLLCIAAVCVSYHVKAQVPGGAPKSAGKQSDALAKARARLARGNLQDAEASLWVILSGHPDHEQALALLADIRIRQQRYAEAEALFGRVLQINPKSAPAHRGLANALGAEQQPQKAVEQYQAALDLDPQNIELRMQAAHLYAAQGQCDKALSALQAIAPNRFPAEAIPVQAACSPAPGKYGEAASFAERAKESPAAEVELAEVFLDAKLPDQALHALDLAAPKLPRKPARFYYLKGRALQAMNQMARASAAFQQALTVDPKFVDPLVALAELQSSANQHDDAVASLQKALTLSSDNVTVLRHLVVEATRASNGKVSVDSASALAEKCHDNPDDLYLAGAALLQENSSGASAVLEKYVALRPDNAKAWLGLGIAYVQEKRFADARKPLERSVQIDPTIAEAEYELGVVGRNVGTSEDAIKHFQRAVELQPNHAKALWNLGNLYLQGGDLGKAQESLQAAEAIDPNSPETEYDLALTLTKQGKPDIAREHFAKYKRLKGEQPAASRDAP